MKEFLLFWHYLTLKCYVLVLTLNTSVMLRGKRSPVVILLLQGPLTSVTNGKLQCIV